MFPASDIVTHSVVADVIESLFRRDNDKYQLELKEKHLKTFAPEDISVKLVDGYISVEGKHEEKVDDIGRISRQFSRRCPLPEDFVAESVEFKFSSKGVLTLIAHRKVREESSDQGESSNAIAQTGPVRKEEKDQADSDK